MGLELDLKHKLFLDGLKQLDDGERESILNLIFASYLIRGKLLENISAWCLMQNIYLPSYSELLGM